MGSISRRVLFALGIGAAAAGRVQAQEAEQDLPTCRLTGERGGWTLISELRSIEDGVPKLRDTLRIADDNHVVSVRVDRTGRDIDSGNLRIVIRQAPRRASRNLGWEQQPVGLVIDGAPVRVGEMALDRNIGGEDKGMVADFRLFEQDLEALLAQLETGSRMVVQSAISSDGSEALSNVASVFDLEPLGGFDEVFRKSHRSMETALRARQCEPGSGGCHLTTVCCGMIGLADDCWELRTLRAFRDGWLIHQEGGRADVARYYREAPEISRALAADPRAAREVYRRYILPSAVMVSLGWNRMAWQIYRRGSTFASNRCRT